MPVKLEPGQWNLRHEWIGPSPRPARTFAD
jgi:hypothetical protein